MDEIHGFIENIVFTEEEKGFTVARLKEPRKKELTCIVGVMPSVQPGETIYCKGVWRVHPDHGPQFEVKAFELRPPTDLLGIQKYLESGMIKGIGAVYAERIVKVFGLATLDVIEQNPERLQEVAGIGKKRIEKIRECWKDQQAVRKVMVFLRGHGASPSLAQKIFKRYGEASIQRVQENPYQLAKEIHGIGFKTADLIAQGIGIGRQAPERIDAGIEHTLWELSSEGHVCYPLKELIPAVEEILQVPGEQIGQRVDVLVARGDLIQEEGTIWVRPLFATEVGIAKELRRLNDHPTLLRAVHVEKALVWAQEKLNLELAPEQSEAVGAGLQEKVLIITGGPGTGKSTITRALLAVTEKISSQILLVAPTGRAAKRMQEITGRKAHTIHSALQIDPKNGKFKRNRENPLECDLLIVDEASMIDTQLMHHLLKAVPSGARLILIGDIHQLPSVGPGTVLKDCICSEKVRVCELKKIFRQAEGSLIITNAHRINRGEFPLLSSDPRSDFQFIMAQTPEEVLANLQELICHKLSKAFHPLEEIQLLCPMKRGMIGCDHLNTVLQQQLNPSPTPLVRMGRSLHLGDKVMQIRNNYDKEVYNGDVGRIVEIDLSEETLKVSFDGRYVSYEFVDIDELVLAYAVSIHKYQGSECPCVVIPVHTTHFKMLFRNLLYTGLTRGKKKVIFVGTTQAIGMAVRNEESFKRHTGLQAALRKYC